MPLFSDEYEGLESKLISLIIQQIDSKDNFDAPPHYPRILVLNEGLVIYCLKSDEDLWIKKMTPALIELFQANNIPMNFGVKDYITVESYSDCHTISVNVSLIELDRLLEKESSEYQKSGKKNALFQKGNREGINSFLPFHVREAINKTIFDKEGYPVAYIVKPNNAFCLACDANDDPYVANAFYNFYLLFEDLCKKHGIEKLPNATKFATSRKVPNSTIIKYEFNISPADMEELLLLECPSYAGYRDAASINRLVDPNGLDVKDGVVCLFPVFLLTDDEYMPRQAGCNISQMISVQLANYIKKYLLADTYVPKEMFFGHHNSALTKDVLKVEEFEIFAAVGKCLDINDGFNHQTESGIRIINKSNTPFIKTICDLDEDSTRIYQRHAVVTHVELKNLKSCEISILDFLDILVESVNDRIRGLLARDDSSTCKFIQERIETSKESLIEINKLKTAIKPNTPRMNH
jgi:hypothetical protein